MLIQIYNLNTYLCNLLNKYFNKNTHFYRIINKATITINIYQYIYAILRIMQYIV